MLQAREALLFVRAAAMNQEMIVIGTQHSAALGHTTFAWRQKLPAEHFSTTVGCGSCLLVLAAASRGRVVVVFVPVVVTSVLGALQLELRSTDSSPSGQRTREKPWSLQ